MGRKDHDYVLTDRDSDSLANAIDLLLSSESMRAEVGKNALDFIRRTMPLSQSIDRHVDVYRSVARTKGLM